MTLRLRAIPYALIAVLALGSRAVADDEASLDARYTAPGAAFSISMRGNDRLWAAKTETVSGETVIVDFNRMIVHGLALLWPRTVEWIRLAKPVDPAEFDFQANAVVKGYLEARFGEGKVTVADRSKSRTASGQLVYSFAAKGVTGGMPAYWQGVVLFFDNGVALVSELVAQPTQHKFDPANGVIFPDAVTWALTIRPGP